MSFWGKVKKTTDKGLGIIFKNCAQRMASLMVGAWSSPLHSQCEEALGLGDTKGSERDPC